MFFSLSDSNDTIATNKQVLQSQIQNCKIEVSTLENQIKKNETDLESLEAKLAQYKKDGEVENYNNLVEPYNLLLTKMKNSVSIYESKVGECNVRIKDYNTD